jgi:HEAT repeat protein
MNLLEKLQNNKGLVSSALSKELAKHYFEGDKQIFEDALQLLGNESKSVRSGSMVIIEEVANKQPDLVAPHLKELLPALEVEEPQTRWVALRTLGKCAHLEPDVAKEGMKKIDKFLGEESLALKDSVITYLGYIGSLSTEDAPEIFPQLERTLSSVPKRITRVFESFQRMIPVLGEEEKKKLAKLAETYSMDEKPSIAKAAKKTAKKLG